MKTKSTDKKKEQELLLRETERALKRELAYIKKRRNLTPEMFEAMIKENQLWRELINLRRKFTPLEELQFDYYIKKKWLCVSKIESMILRCKRGPYDPALDELSHIFGINVRNYLLQISQLSEKGDGLNTRIDELQDKLISSLKSIIELQTEILGIPSKSPLVVV